MIDAFETRSRRPAGVFHGRVSILPSDPGNGNYCDLIAGGYDVLICLNGRAEPDCVTADPAEGWIEKHHRIGWAVTKDVKRGHVEVKLRRR
jgi:hypothetical protein